MKLYELLFIFANLNTGDVVIKHFPHENMTSCILESIELQSAVDEENSGGSQYIISCVEVGGALSVSTTK